MPDEHRTSLGIAGPGRSRRGLERATLYGLAGSALVHLLIVLLAALVTVRFSFGDAGGSAGSGVEFAVLDSDGLAEDAGPALRPDHAPVETSPSESASRLDLLADRAEDRTFNDLSESIAPALEAGGGGSAAMEAETGSAGAGSGSGSSFFGLEAKGRRFAYIVDLSGSMNGPAGPRGSRWDLTRAELARSVRALDEGAEFHVQLFADGAVSLFGVEAWSSSTPTNKRLTADALALQNPAGGTRPLPAFETVLRLSPRADAIYFMTDGEVPGAAEFIAAVRRLNGRRPVPIHCILFGGPTDAEALRRVEGVMRSIAAQSGGRYRRIGGAG